MGYPTAAQSKDRSLSKSELAKWIESEILVEVDASGARFNRCRTDSWRVGTRDEIDLDENFQSWVVTATGEKTSC